MAEQEAVVEDRETMRSSCVEQGEARSDHTQSSLTRPGLHQSGGWQYCFRVGLLTWSMLDARISGWCHFGCYGVMRQMAVAAVQQKHE